ncbi:bifunctional adenosylcobinamide kinase/adenosylcobinamide-phosphate guanylyltransferase [Metasolibacillus meyeri]|uniref:Adenosylcobinamide kinase n=1 Tax=Metasolibacillus meyeri TaxID=1071052 RepID=A0AAW9NWQ6_9BACL|nr:bifunctional adenosylcobinamide kinase/adenosylcobinamide-phosphate guanylyltransferase [Metasolibacillus meyeri]MEC1179979.1 bifunctional adenosylcobinamide kinase/adenosylcobinamide-phosphate guanylyltransferase [Metasolibacillus meyeri]
MGRLIFVTGGVRSGKSAFAERYAQQVANGQTLTYIASGVAFDTEMQARIARHRADREQSEAVWRTLEVPDTLPDELLTLECGTVVLWDCLTTWLGNIMYKTKDTAPYIKSFQYYIEEWKKQNILVVLVSNEVMDEPSSKYEEVELYKQLLGELHQWIVAQCDEAYEIDHQLCKRWK